MLNARIKFFSQKAGKPQQVPLWIAGSSGYIRGNDETSVTSPRVPQAGCEVQLPQFEASWCLLALIEPTDPRDGSPSRVTAATLQGSDLKSDVPQWSALMVKCAGTRIGLGVLGRHQPHRKDFLHATQTN
jgi:hypothetical protein